MHTRTVIRLLHYLLLLIPFASQAEEHWYNYDHLYFQVGTYIHYDPSDDHSGTRIVASLEAVKSNGWLYGLSLFNNSFDQFSQYLYGGKMWNFHGKLEGFTAKITAGLIHGYKDEFKDKIPNNGLGVAPAIIPSIGYKKGRYTFETALLGVSAMAFTLGMDF